MEWHEDPLGIIHDAGEVGGDVQAGPSHSRRFMFGPIDGLWMVVEEYTYADTDNPDHDEDDDQPTLYGVETMTMLTACTSPEDPGSTEVWSDVQYASMEGGGDPFIYEDAEAADHAARRLIERMTSDYYWDPTEDLREHAEYLRG